MKTKKRHTPDKKIKEQNNNSADDRLTPAELAFLTGTTPEIIEELADLELIVPRGQPATYLFQAETVQVVLKILRLQRHLQVSFDSLSLVFDLLDRIAALEKRIDELENK
jgi:hypothetical protein